MEEDNDCCQDMDTDYCQDVKCSPMVEEWLRNDKFGLFNAPMLRAYWKEEVPKVFSPQKDQNCLNYSYDEDLVEERLFTPMEQFICSNSKPKDVFKSIRMSDKPASLCGKVFKYGEPTYSCRDCALDRTCVLCVNCFSNSAHKNHKYRMYTSGGGGYCDCGDIEAWKADHFCSVHIKGSNSKSDEVLLDSDLSSRALIIFKTVLQYAYHILTHEQGISFPHEWEMDNCDNKATVVYNDETHGFDQVISALKKSIKANQKDAMEITTTIDREGRGMVICGNFQECYRVKQSIEKSMSRQPGNARPFRVDLVDDYVYAHQTFALLLLGWMQRIMGHSAKFRHLFRIVIMEPVESRLTKNTMLESLCLKNTSLWKSARVRWQHLLIDGMLLDNENKKLFAKVFTKHYVELMRDYSLDDHEHGISIMGLTVQLYTVPTIAHMLIAENDALAEIFRTMNSLMDVKENRSGVPESQIHTGPHFTRTLYAMYDLKYLLSTKPEPETFTLAMQKGFLHGFNSLLELLSHMHNMDSVVREVDTHVEFESDWSAPFNLQIKLESVISSMTEWCGLCKSVFIKAYRMTLKALEAKYTHERNKICITKEVANHSVGCIDYDVSKSAVSIHLPLTRLLAGLHLHLERFNLTYDSIEFQLPFKLTPTWLVEPVLRTTVLVAQVHAGMWRKNGHALINQVYFYHNLRCRKEMLDKDVLMLQEAASLIPSDDFMVHILNKFNLIEWAQPDYEKKREKKKKEDDTMQVVNVVEEFLLILITIISERYTPGVGMVSSRDCIKKEVIQMLCVEPLPHSQLMFYLPDEVNDESNVDEIINEVATFVKATTTSGKGLYHLKEEFYPWYNVFFYHYTKEKQSKSEETMRKGRTSQSSGTEREAFCTPPPLVPLSAAFRMLSNLLQCDVMVYVMKTVLERCANLDARIFSENMFREILFLIGFALWEEEHCIRTSDPFITFTKRAEPYNIIGCLEKLSNFTRVDAHQELLCWTINKYKKVLDLYQGNPNAGKSSSSATDQMNEDLLKIKKAERAKQAQRRRDNIMKKMKDAQSKFLSKNVDLFTSRAPEISEPVEMEVDVVQEGPDVFTQRVALGPQQTARMPEQLSFSCILCMEDQTISLDAPAMVLAAFVQNSTVLNQSPLSNEPVSTEFPYLLSANLEKGLHTTSCGHVMHAGCWQKYIDQIIAKATSRYHRHYLSFDVDKKEFLCPLCECLSNTVLPVMPPLRVGQLPPAEPLSLSLWLKFFQHFNNILNVPHCVADTVNAASSSTPPLWSVGTLDDVFATSQGLEPVQALLKRCVPPATISTTLNDMLQYFAICAFDVSGSQLPDERNPRVIAVVWESIAYTLHSTGWLLREQGRALIGDMPVRQRDTLQSMIRIGATLPVYSTIKHWVKVFLSGIVQKYLGENSDGCVLSVDAGSLLVSLALSSHGIVTEDEDRKEFPSVPSGDTMDLLNTSLVFLLHIVQILLTGDFNERTPRNSDTEIPEHVSKEAAILHDFYVQVCSSYMECVPVISAHSLYCRVMEACVPWLRLAALFWHFLIGVVPPAELNEPGGDTYTSLLGYLGLSDFFTKNFDDEVKELAKRWFLRGVSYLTATLFPVTPRKLVPLPEHYSDLLNSTSSFVCPTKDTEDSVTPAMCLICGALVCSQNYCCQKEIEEGKFLGPCNYHARNCGAGVGIFLRIRECRILLLIPRNKGCFQPAPYVDDYGEPDQKLKRGDPLHLCKDSYRNLYLRWLQHRIPEEVMRAVGNAGLLHTMPQDFQYF